MIGVSYVSDNLTSPIVIVLEVIFFDSRIINLSLKDLDVADAEDNRFILYSLPR